MIRVTLIKRTLKKNNRVLCVASFDKNNLFKNINSILKESNNSVNGIYIDYDAFAAGLEYIRILIPPQKNAGILNIKIIYYDLFYL